jgi:hypothetical protein
MASLPQGVIIYKDSSLAKSELVNYANKPGIYLWSNNNTGDQYVGSSENLKNRLTDYFQLSQLNNQVNNSNSLICSSILSYGWSAFSLSIYVCDSDMNIIGLEQSYLDNYLLTLNIRRSATPANYNSGRFKIPVYVYNNNLTTLLAWFPSITSFQLFSGLNGTQIKILLESSSKLWRDFYFLSSTLLLDADNTALDLPNNFKPIEPKGIKSTFSVITKNISTNETFKFPSQAKCAIFLNVDPHVISKAIKEGKVIKGYFISRI